MQDESKKQQQLEWKEVTWEFDIKDQTHLTQKYGNFSSPTLIKLISKYNKAASESGGIKTDAAKIGDIITNELNLRLEDEGE